MEVMVMEKIKEEDLKDDSGNYWSVARDLSFMFPRTSKLVVSKYESIYLSH